MKQHNYTTYLIADLHFGHKGVIKYRTDFETTAHMEALITYNWVNVVNPEDHVFILGDAAMNLAGHERVGQLPGRKTLILGNHDDNSVIKLAAIYDKVILMKETTRSGIEFVLTHVPVHTSMLYSHMNGNGERWGINIHGHIHERVIPSLEEDKRYFNVSVERLDYTPIAFKTVINYYLERGAYAQI